MKNTPTAAEINSLFANSNPEEAWQKALEIVVSINPSHNTSLVRSVFDDVMRLFSGVYPGYCSIKTLFHDQHHTLDVFLCSARLMYGVYKSGVRLTDDEITIILIAALMHDVGYAQRDGEEYGTGAQHTQIHVNRSIEFMQHYFVENDFSSQLAAQLGFVILCSNPAIMISEIQFPDERTMLLGKILATADLTGQMADRSYLEKLLFLYLEFKEASFGNYQNIHDLLRKTQLFYGTAQLRLLEQCSAINAELSRYFKDCYGVEINFYQESINKNLAYLDKITALDDANHRAMLKRSGVVEKAEHLVGFVGGRAAS
jgi:hypothetical protein